MAFLDARAQVTTIDYNRLSYKHPRLEQVPAAGFWAAPGTFDVVLSASSLDHDGLGRYGDPVSPDGDLLTMDALGGVLADGGVLLLSVPVGPDALAWNLMRVYGKVRLPLLLGGYEVAARYGFDERRVAAPVENLRVTYEPVFALRRPSTRRSELR